MNGLAWAEALQGTTLKALKKLADKQNGNYSAVLRALKRGFHKGRNLSWKVQEGKGNTLKIFNVEHAKAPVKAKEAAAKKASSKKKTTKK